MYLELKFKNEKVDVKVLGTTTVGKQEYIVMIDNRKDIWIYRKNGKQLKEITNKKEFVNVCDHLNSLIGEEDEIEMSKSTRFKEEDNSIICLNIAEIASDDASDREIKEGISKRYIEETPEDENKFETEEKPEIGETQRGRTKQEEENAQNGWNDDAEEVKTPKRRKRPYEENGEDEQQKEKAKPKKKQRRVEIEEGSNKTTFLTDKQEEEEAYITDLRTGKHYVIDTQPYRIGKLQDNDLSINIDVISRHHAEIVSYGGKYFIRDCDSLNGTFVNGYRLPKETDMELKDGQEFILANRKYKMHCKAE